MKQLTWNIKDTRDGTLVTEFMVFGPGSYGIVITSTRREEADWVCEKMNDRCSLDSSPYEVVEVK